MKASRFLYLAALALPCASHAQLTLSRVQDVARDPYQFSAMEVMDVDGDGDDDLIFHGAGNMLTVWSENRAGTFAATKEIQIAPRVFNTAMPDLADLEGDGRKDFYTIGALTRTRNLGGGNFSEPEPWPGKSWPHPDDRPDPAIYDKYLSPLRGVDGKDKLVLQRLDGDTNTTQYLLIGPGENGTLVESPLLIDGMLGPQSPLWERDRIKWLDVDRDGDTDLICTDFNLSALQVYRNRGDDSFEAPVEASRTNGSAQVSIAPALLEVAGRGLPSLVHKGGRTLNDQPWLENYLVIRHQTLDESGYRIETENTAHRISLGRDELKGMLVAEGAEGPELWIRVIPWATEDLPTERLRAYRYDPVSGWTQFGDQALPSYGNGDLHLLSLTPGGALGLAFRMGSDKDHISVTEEKVLWASLESLRSATPAWQTIAGPFNDFKDLHVADLDRDGKADLVSGVKDHNISRGHSGRFHLIHDIGGERSRTVLDTDPEGTIWFSQIEGANRAAIGDLDGDQLPDLLVSDGPGSTLRFLKNLGNRAFAAPEVRVTGNDRLLPGRVEPGKLIYQNQGEFFSQAAAPGSPSLPLYDLGTTGTVVHCDMDEDGDLDVVAYPCPLGRAVGWGETGPEGNLLQWHLLTYSQGREIRTPGGKPSMGWVNYDTDTPIFERVVEGVPGVESSPLPDYNSDAIWPPLDLDGDGDYDQLILNRSAREVSFSITGPHELTWVENAGSTAINHPQPLWRTFLFDTDDSLTTLQVVEQTAGTTRVLLGTNSGEAFLLDFAAPQPGGPFLQWLASFDLTGEDAGAEADPDQDGLTNLEEALQGTSPVSPDAGGFRLPVSRATGETWSFTSGIELAGSGVKIVTQTSDDLEEWETLPGTPVVSGTAGAKFVYRIIDSAISMEPKRFVRLKFTWEAE